MDIGPIEADGAIGLRPIGIIHSDICRQQTGGFGAVETSVELRPELREYLEGIEDYSHL